MKTYIVQIRYSDGGRLVTVGEFRAIGPAQAIRQALYVCIRGGESPVQFIATLQGETQ